MSGGTPYIGSTISLISKAEIRYEGILWSIDTKDSTVTLANVRSYGTEDRQVEKQVAARTEVYEYIVFRGSDIKDLHVSKAPKKPDTVNQDPSILQQGAVGSNFTQFPNSPYASSYPAHPYGYGYQTPYSPVPRQGLAGRAVSPAGIALARSRTPTPPVAPIGSAPQRKTHESETQTPSQKSTQTGKQNRKPSSRKNSLDSKQNGPNVVPQEVKKEEINKEEVNRKEKPQRGNPRNRGGNNQQSTSRRTKNQNIKVDEEFDFETSNAKFDKEKMEEELMMEIEKMKISHQDDEVIVENGSEMENPGEDVYYDKSKSFFDSLSNDHVLPCEPEKRTSTWQEERKLNVETFGVASPARRGRGWRGGRWRGRGRGGGRGRGRGGRGGAQSGSEQNEPPKQRYGNRNSRGNYRGNRQGQDKTSENRSPNVNRGVNERNKNTT